MIKKQQRAHFVIKFKVLALGIIFFYVLILLTLAIIRGVWFNSPNEKADGTQILAPSNNIYYTPSPNLSLPLDYPLYPLEKNDKLWKILETQANSDKTVLIIPVNFSFLGVARNLLCSLKAADVKNYFVWALDSKVNDIFTNEKIPVYFDDKFFGTDKLVHWHNAVYNKMMRERPIFYRRVLEAGYNFLFVDADIVVLKNPLPYLRYDSDLEIQLDGYDIHSWTLATGLPDYQLPFACGGLFYLKSSAGGIRFVSDLEILLQKYEDIEDQEGINSLILEGHFKALIMNLWEEGKKVSFEDEPPRYKVRFMPQYIFMNGHILERALTEGQWSRTAVDPAMIHFNGFSDKKAQASSMSLWFLNEDGVTCSKD